jgi:hypothetical protein
MLVCRHHQQKQPSEEDEQAECDAQGGAMWTRTTVARMLQRRLLPLDFGLGGIATHFVAASLPGSR